MYKLIVSAVLIVTVHTTVKFDIKNNDGGDVWIGIQGNTNYEHLEKGGFILGSGKTRSIQAPDNWEGRFWARTWCDPRTNTCLTGDCGNRLECEGNGGNPPASIAEITLKGKYGLDYYDLSLVDGFNTLVSIEPIDGSKDGSKNSCKKLSCAYHFNNDCPDKLKKDTEHGVVACKSACVAFQRPEYCCTKPYDQPQTCNSSNWPVNYPAYFKTHCPDAYSYAYDDRKSLITCKAEHYIITFGG